MSGVHDDLALREDMEYLRAVLTYGAADAYVETASLNALDRVEAEIARLREQRDAPTKSGLVTRLTQRAEAAEARCARLQQALRGTRERTAPDGQPCWCPDWKVDDWRGYSTDDWRDPDLQAALHHECCIAAREALAGLDTPATTAERRVAAVVAEANADLSMARHALMVEPSAVGATP